MPWLSRRERHRVRALRQALDRLGNEGSRQEQTAWLDEASDLLHLSLSKGSQILEEFKVARKKIEYKVVCPEYKKELLNRIQCLINSASSILPLQSNRSSSLLDEFALASVIGEDEESAFNKFEMKRALYASFANSWPLRITFILLFIALCLVGWQTTRLANIGSHAREIAENAKDQVKKASNDLVISQRNLESLVAMGEREREAAKQKLDEQFKKAIKGLSHAEESGLEGIKSALKSKESDLIRDLTAVSKKVKVSLNQQLKDTKVDLAALLDEVALLEKDGKTEIQEVFKTTRIDLETFQSNERVKMEAVLSKHLETQAKRLTERTTNLVTTLEEWQGAGESQVKAVVAKVEAQENQWILHNKERFKELEKKIAAVESYYDAHLRLSRQIANVAEQVREEARWIKPAWITAVLEIRTGFVILAALMAILAAFIAWRAHK